MEKELRVKYDKGKLILDEKGKELFESLGIKNIQIKVALDILEICKKNKISFKKVKKIADTQRIPIEVALGVFLSLGKLISKSSKYQEVV